MKYTVTLDIKVPVSKLVSLFDNSENMHTWMEGLESVKHLDGKPGDVGAKSKMVFQMGKRRIEMVETITVKNLPDEFTATYHTPGVFNIVSNRFQAIDERTTRYITEQEFQFQSFGMKLMGLIMPGAFKKQSMSHMKSFKAFAEAQN